MLEILQQEILNLYAKSWLVVALASFIKTRRNYSTNESPEPLPVSLVTNGDK